MRSQRKGRTQPYWVALKIVAKPQAQTTSQGPYRSKDTSRQDAAAPLLQTNRRS